jgi:hypothetical protein
MDPIMTTNARHHVVVGAVIAAVAYVVWIVVSMIITLLLPRLVHDNKVVVNTMRMVIFGPLVWLRAMVDMNTNLFGDCIGSKGLFIIVECFVLPFSHGFSLNLV